MPILRHEETRHRTLRPNHRSQEHCIWIAKCHGCPNAVWITTPDDSIKTAIRGWNRYANGEWRKVLEDWRAGQGVPCRDRTRRIHRPPNHEGHEMRINFNSKDGVFAIKAENEEEKTQLKTSAVAICNLIIDFFDADINEAKVERE